MAVNLFGHKQDLCRLRDKTNVKNSIQKLGLWI